MRKQNPSDQTGLYILLGAGAAAYLLYANGTLASWFPSIFGTAAAVATPPAPVSGAIAQTPTATNNPGSITPVGPSSSPTPAAPAATLTVQDAATFPYSSSVTAAQMNSVNAALQTEIHAGDVPQIAGNSVLAFMLGWGGQNSGASEVALGETYVFDGTNWNLTFPSSDAVNNTILPNSSQSSSLSGLGRGTRVPLGMIHGRGDYRFRGGW